MEVFLLLVRLVESLLLRQEFLLPFPLLFRRRTDRTSKTMVSWQQQRRHHPKKFVNWIVHAGVEANLTASMTSHPPTQKVEPIYTPRRQDLHEFASSLRHRIIPTPDQTITAMVHVVAVVVRTIITAVVVAGLVPQYHHLRSFRHGTTQGSMISSLLSARRTRRRKVPVGTITAVVVKRLVQLGLQWVVVRLILPNDRPVEGQDHLLVRFRILAMKTTTKNSYRSNAKS
mmetsp:Transcript_36810/g.89154  ORF Transcript_36810/g.89154 Transcript_36810/m.89154 type:complete len:229 (+) Transcript_36810:278-964(+)